MSLTFRSKTIFYILICFHFQLILSAQYVKHLVPRKHNASLRVYNGKPAQLGEIPYQVAFKTKVQGLYMTFCGGSIIGESKLLTAAHCFVADDTGISNMCKGYEPPSLKNKYAVAATVRNYEYVFDSNSQWRELRNITYPSAYKFPIHDIAILFVTYPFEFNRYVQPITMASIFKDYNGVCLVSGYGRISHDLLSDSLMKADLILYPDEQCKMVHRKDMSNFVCTSIIGTDIGQGDSGGPLVCKRTGDPVEKGGKGILVGVASGTYEGYNSIFTRVSKFRQYIDRNSCKISGASIYIVAFTLFVLENIYQLLTF